MSVREWCVGSDYLFCNQHHEHKTMQEVEDCNQLTGQKMANDAGVELAKVKLEGMDKCIKMEETRTDRLERVGGVFDSLQKMNMDLTRPEHLALINKILTDDNVGRNMNSLEPASNMNSLEPARK